MKNKIGFFLFLLLIISGLSEVIFLNNGKIIEGSLEKINNGIVIVEVDDYSHMFPSSSITYVFFSENYDFKNGFYLKNDIVIKAEIPLVGIEEDNLIFQNGNSKMVLNKKNILQFSFNNHYEKTNIKIKDTLIDFKQFESKNNNEHTVITKNGEVKLNFNDLSKFEKDNKDFILNKNDNVIFCENLTITKKGLKPFIEDDYYIKDFNSLSLLNQELEAKYNENNEIYTLVTKNKSLSSKVIDYFDGYIKMNGEKVEKEEIKSINKNLLYVRNMDFFTSGENGEKYYLLDNNNKLSILSENGTVLKSKLIKDYIKTHSIYLIKGNEKFIFLRNERTLYIFDAKTLELVKKHEFSYQFSYDLSEKYIIIYSSFSPDVYVYSAKDLSLLKEYNLNINVKDTAHYNNEGYIIYSTYLYKYIDDKFRIIEDLKDKIYNLNIINEKLYLLAYEHVYVYETGDIKKIKTEPIYRYKHDGKSLFVSSRNKIFAIQNDEIKWEINFGEKTTKSSIVLNGDYIYTIYGDVLYKISKKGEYEILYTGILDNSFHNIHLIKNKYLLISCEDKVIQLMIPE
ncbi:MAG: hypothetical protein ACQESN_07480 [Thermotogota bacterium]